MTSVTKRTVVIPLEIEHMQYGTGNVVRTVQVRIYINCQPRDEMILQSHNHSQTNTISYHSVHDFAIHFFHRAQ